MNNAERCEKLNGINCVLYNGTQELLPAFPTFIPNDNDNDIEGRLRRFMNEKIISFFSFEMNVIQNV